MKLVIIGNGFDMHHGLETSFRSFRSFLVENRKIELVQSIDSIITYNNKIVNVEDVMLAWNDIEKILYDKFNQIKNNEDDLDKFENVLEDFVYELNEYLKIVSNKDIIINKKIEEVICDADAILVFNYTKTFKKYIDEESTAIFHIHGCLEDDNCPLIGYHCSIGRDSSLDYRVRFGNTIIDKTAMAYKQTNRDLASEISGFTQKYKNVINEVVIIGYSFGESDSHIYKILDEVLIKQTNDKNILASEADKLEKIMFQIFSYSDDETNILIDRISYFLNLKFKRKAQVNKFGCGIKREKEQLIRFKKLYY